MLYRDSESWRRYARPREIIPLTWAASSASSDAPMLPMADASVDLVLSSMHLHWVNDVPGTLREALRVLRPDGVFLAAFLGGETLAELRSAWVAAETERDGGVSPRVSPMMGAADAGNLLTAAGFGIPTIDTDVMTVEYPSALAAMEHLQAMGEQGAALGARAGARADALLAAAAAYGHMYPGGVMEEGQEGGEGGAAPAAGVAAAGGGGGGSRRAADDGSVTASFEVVYMIGWKPAPTQPRPLQRGSVPKGFGQRKVSGAQGGAAPLV